MAKCAALGASWCCTRTRLSGSLRRWKGRAGFFPFPADLFEAVGVRLGVLYAPVEQGPAIVARRPARPGPASLEAPCVNVDDDGDRLYSVARRDQGTIGAGGGGGGPAGSCTAVPASTPPSPGAAPTRRSTWTTAGWSRRVPASGAGTQARSSPVPSPLWGNFHTCSTRRRP